MIDTKSTLLSNWFEEVWNNSRREAIDELLAENVIAHGLGPNGFTEGVEAFKDFYDDFRTQLGNVQVYVENVMSDGDMESALCQLKAVHIPSGKHVEFAGTCTVKIKNGQIIQAWNHFDFLKMYRQMGYELKLP